jgi:hypothetical protein
MFFKRVCLLVISASLATGFAPTKNVPSNSLSLAAVKDSNEEGKQLVSDRRAFVSSICTAGLLLSTTSEPAFADDGAEEESFASIAARASKLSGEVGEATPVQPMTDDNRTAYDFSLPMSGVEVPFKNIVRQEYNEEGRAKLKAILVVNMKEDDPTARKDIPEFISMASKYVL